MEAKDKGNDLLGKIYCKSTKYVEVKSLGLNTVTSKGNQMIVSGPDIAQAQQIAKQLSTGAAKLATLNGKQVLISTQPTVISQTQKLANTSVAAPASSATMTPTSVPMGPATPAAPPAAPSTVQAPQPQQAPPG